MSQRKMIIFIDSAALVLAITVSVGIYAATEDKDLTLVSVDYVENALKPWVKEQVSAGNGIYEVVYLTKGQKLLPQGSAEIVLRSGAAVSVSPSAVQGLSDLTAGKELYDGDAITVNHQLLVPRPDGRGIRITSGEAYVMIRGAYTIE